MRGFEQGQGVGCSGKCWCFCLVLSDFLWYFLCTTYAASALTSVCFKVWTWDSSLEACPQATRAALPYTQESKRACLGFTFSLGWLLTNDHQTLDCESPAPLPLFGTILRFLYSLDFSWGTRLKPKLCSTLPESTLCLASILSLSWFSGPYWSPQEAPSE